MGWFTKKPATPKTPTRVHSALLSPEPSITALAASCITAAEAEHTADPISVQSGIYSIVSAQVDQMFTALGRARDGQGFDNLFALDHYTDQHLWDYLTGDGGKLLFTTASPNSSSQNNSKTSSPPPSTTDTTTPPPPSPNHHL